MSGSVVYLERAERGGRLSGLRLCLAGKLSRWTAPAPRGDDASAAQDVSVLRDAARWIRQQMQIASRRAGGPDVMVLDVDGSLCSWLGTTTRDRTVVQALVRQTSVTGEGAGPWGADAAIPGAASVQALGAGAARVGVLATPDAPARLLIDELDALSSTPDSVLSLWHALALAWDPAAVGDGPSASDGEVSAAAPMVAIVLIDPRGRLVWTWSRGGEVLAAGAQALGHDENDEVCVAASDIGRLTNDWLAWSVQLGCSPLRVSAIAPEPACSVQTDASDRPSSLAHGLSGALPDTTVDVIADDDPIGATLLRLSSIAGFASEQSQRPERAIVELSNRPGRAHRGLWRWSAAALLAGAAGIAFVAYRVWEDAGLVRDRARQRSGEWRLVLDEVYPEALLSATPELDLETEFERRRRLVDLPEVKPPMPVLAELESIALVVGNGEIELNEVSVDESLGVRVIVVVPDVPTLELLRDAFRSVGGSSIRWTSDDFRPVDRGRIQCTFRGVWPEQGAGGTAS
ncbi:MAG: hypothetical protein RBS39_08900 [Phycisphaerales bacterium]|nr:hypothetical protein [Phycisphaerales bacterium]